jgi:hypothetical protein
MFSSRSWNFVHRNRPYNLQASTAAVCVLPGYFDTWLTAVNVNELTLYVVLWNMILVFFVLMQELCDNFEWNMWDLKFSQCCFCLFVCCCCCCCKLSGIWYCVTGTQAFFVQVLSVCLTLKFKALHSLKHQGLLRQWHSISSQKTWAFCDLELFIFTY